MDLTAWAAYAFITAAAFAATLLHYRRHEPPGRGRTLLAALRGLVFGVLILLLFDPRVPAVVPGTRAATTVLVDASLSMRLADSTGTSRWEEAAGIVGRLRADRVLLFGAGDARQVATLQGSAPTDGASRLAPALRAAAEAGAARVVVVTDGGVEDAAEASRVAASSGVSVELRTVGERTRANLGLWEVRAPEWAEVGEEATVEVELARVGTGAPDSVTLVLTREDRELVRTRVAVPGEGRTSTASLRFVPQAGSDEPVRFGVRILEGDGEPADDRRTVYIRVAEEPPGVVLLSFRPDQEPRFLLPVLERSLGVPATGWMVFPGGRFIRLGYGAEAGLVVDEPTARTAAENPDVLVLHGMDGDAPAWARQAATRARRLLVFPSAGSAPTGPLEVGPAQQGDWYPFAELPPSPIAALLAGMDPGDAPPLTSLRDAAIPAGWWSPVNARLGRRGQPEPVLVAGRSGERRIAVALAEGYWRWAFAGGSGRGLYDRLWSAVAGWLAEEEGETEAVVRPVRRSVPAAEPVRFAGPAGTDSMHVVLTAGAGGAPAGAGDGATPDSVASPGEPQDGAATTAVVDTFLTAVDDTVTLDGLPPGRYRYRVRTIGSEPDQGGDGQERAISAAGEGEITVESWSPELTRPIAPLRLGGEGDGEGGGSAGRGGRPLHATPWPYGALVLLLCVEWALRRRWGLR